MEENPIPHKKSKTTAEVRKPQVYVLRDWKEYLGESSLIVFSVLLALVLTEYFNNLHEKRDTRELLNNVRTELIRNRKAEREQYVYQQNILKAIDSALKTPAFMQKIVSDDEFHWKYIMPDGVVNRDLSTVAWDVAKGHNITTKAPFGLISILTDIYANQARIDKVEEKVATVLLSWESRKTANIHETLILLRDNYKGWAFDRAPGLIAKYDEAIKMLDAEK
ncbi:MAG: hypothetical protein JWP37_3213 [Mucilaginibacter sp.]|nr:hypothetical protein [Mucilaginibacter sp.]